MKQIIKKLYQYRVFYCIINYLYNFYITSAIFNPLARQKHTKHLSDEIEVFFDKLKRNENFALSRNADGERAIMQGRSVISQENYWTSPNYICKLGVDILDSLNIVDSRFYYAISCPCCDKEAYFWYKSRIDSTNITFANLWININFQHFKRYFEQLNRDCVLIANYRATILMQNGAKLGNMKILKHYEISDDCISFWENEAPNMIEQIKHDFSDRENLLFIVSAGPMSSPIIKALFLHNPNNTYVDFGSSIDSYYITKETRPYQDKYSIFGSRNCYLPTMLDTNISVVLTLYKRGFTLKEQLEAIENQSIKPKEIILFVDSPTQQTIESPTSDISSIFYSPFLNEIPNDLLDKFDNIISVRYNIGVWGRFAGGLLAKSKFVCFFDDDTIPAHRWLENCFCEHLKCEGLYGGVGIISNDLSYYPFDKFYKVGWEHKPPFCINNAKTRKVDFVGHSWFIKKDYLGAMWINASEFYMLKNVAEDAYLSFALKKFLGICTFVPPHNNKDFISSIKGVEYGTNDDAISQNIDNFHKMNNALKLLKKKGMRETNFSIKYQLIFLVRKVIKKYIKNKNAIEKIKTKFKQ